MLKKPMIMFFDDEIQLRHPKKKGSYQSTYLGLTCIYKEWNREMVTDTLLYVGINTNPRDLIKQNLQVRIDYLYKISKQDRPTVKVYGVTRTKAKYLVKVFRGLYTKVNKGCYDINQIFILRKIKSKEFYNVIK